MTRITLHGKLGETVGREWNLLVDSVSEALRGIQANNKHFFEYLAEDAGKAGYRVVINGVDHTHVTELQIPRKTIRTIDIVPVPHGASGGLWQIIAGVVLIIVAVVIIAIAPEASPGVYPLFSIAGTSIGLSAATIGTLGIALALGGIVAMLSKSPALSAANTPKDAAQTSDTTKTSYLFSGTTNTVTQGNCVPLAYGRFMGGSQLITFGIFNYALDPTVALGEGPNAPDTNSDFESETLWSDLTNSLFFRPYLLLSDVTKQGSARTIVIARALQLIPQMGSAPSLAKMRALLATVWYIFKGPRLSKITKKEAWNVYLALDLDLGHNRYVADDGSLVLYRNIDKNTIVEAIGNFYETLI